MFKAIGYSKKASGKASKAPKASPKERSPAVSLLFGMWTAYAITAIIFIAYALLLTYTGVTEKNLQLVVILTTILSVSVAGFDAAKGAKEKGWMWGAFAGIGYALTLIIINCVINQSLTLGGSALTILLISMAAGALRHVWNQHKKTITLHT